MRVFSLAVLMLAGCGSEPVGEGNVTANQIERLSAPAEKPATDPQASARLQPLDPGDITHEGLSGPGCSFSIGGAILLVANRGDAIARVGGEMLHFTHSAPVGPSGGFFEDRRTSISVGRTDATENPARNMIGWPARITVTNRRTGAQVEQDGTWRCGA